MCPNFVHICPCKGENVTVQSWRTLVIFTVIICRISNSFGRLWVSLDTTFAPSDAERRTIRGPSLLLPEFSFFFWFWNFHMKFSLAVYIPLSDSSGYFPFSSSSMDHPEAEVSFGWFWSAASSSLVPSQMISHWTLLSNFHASNKTFLELGYNLDCWDTDLCDWLYLSLVPYYLYIDQIDKLKYPTLCSQRSNDTVMFQVLSLVQ